jgi:hypothetical protein
MTIETEVEIIEVQNGLNDITFRPTLEVVAKFSVPLGLHVSNNETELATKIGELFIEKLKAKLHLKDKV